jgi:hypothetical protein
MSNPNQPPSHAGGEHTTSEGTARDLGSAALGGNMQPAPSGEVLLDAIQQRFRAGEIKAAVPPSPAVVKRHQSAVSAMNAAVDEWCERHPTEGVKMDELGSRIKSTWTKHAFASDDPNAVLNDHTSLSTTLGAYQGRVKQTRAAGFNAAEGIALYTRQYVRQP